MGTGFQVFGPDGSIVLDTSTRAGRIMGKITLNTQTGTTATLVPFNIAGTFFIFCPKLPTPSYDAQFGEVYLGGNFTLDNANRKFSWNFQTLQAACDVYYGMY